MQLEWETQEEEDGRRQKDAPDVDAPAQKRRGRPWWLWSLLSLLLAAAVIWGVRYVLLKRLEAISADFEAEVLEIHAIVQQAERDRDEALFGSMISSEYPNWGGRQKRMLRSGMRWDRAFFGLTLAHDADDKPPTGALADIEFTSDWRMATVTLAYPYEQVDGPPVTLEQTVTYREGMTGWALVPAYPAFWGETGTFKGRYVTVEYPERDAATVERLAREWDELLATACEALDDLRCGRAWKLEVELSTESGTLARMAEGAASRSRWMEMFNAPLPERGANGSGLRLPTPSIIGLPVDDAGYGALRAGYAPLIIGGGIAEIVGWPCCANGVNASAQARSRGQQGAVFFRALLDKQLSQLGLIAWPITAATYEDILQGPIHDVTNLHWVYLQRSDNNIDPRIGKIVYSMVDFILAAQPEQSPAALQRTLLRYAAYRPWLLNAGFNSYGRSIQKEWIRYADQQLAASTAAEDALPTQELQLLCAAERFQGASVYRYTQSGAFVEEAIDGAFRMMYALPGADGVLLQRTGERLSTAASDSPVQIWSQGRAQSVAYRASNPPLFAVETFTDGILFYAYDGRLSTVRFNYLNLAECERGACALEPLEGLPVWSPDGDKTIVSHGDGVLWLGDESGESHTAVARGRSVAWLDNERFAFIQPDDAMRVEVMTLPQAEAETLLEMERVVEALRRAPGAGQMAADRSLPITLVELVTHPTMADLLFVAAHVGDRRTSGTAHIFAYSLATGEIRQLLQVEHFLEPIRSPRFSADGRWLFVHSVDRSAGSWYLHLYDIQTGKSQVYSSESTLAFPGYDLSADGAWLVRVDEGFLHLIPLHEGRQRLVAHDFAHCYAAVWVEGSFQ